MSYLSQGRLLGNPFLLGLPPRLEQKPPEGLQSSAPRPSARSKSRRPQTLQTSHTSPEPNPPARNVGRPVARVPGLRGRGGLPVSRWFWKTVPTGSFSNDPEAAPCAPNQACPLGSEASVLLLPQLGGWRASAEDAGNIPKHRAFDFEDKRVFSDRRFVADLP